MSSRRRSRREEPAAFQPRTVPVHAASHALPGEVVAAFQAEITAAGWSDAEAPVLLDAWLKEHITAPPEPITADDFVLSDRADAAVIEMVSCAVAGDNAGTQRAYLGIQVEEGAVAGMLAAWAYTRWLASIIQLPEPSPMAADLLHNRGPHGLLADMMNSNGDPTQRVLYERLARSFDRDNGWQELLTIVPSYVIGVFGLSLAAAVHLTLLAVHSGTDLQSLTSAYMGGRPYLPYKFTPTFTK